MKFELKINEPQKWTSWTLPMLDIFEPIGSCFQHFRFAAKKWIDPIYQNNIGKSTSRGGVSLGEMGEVRQVIRSYTSSHMPIC